MSFSHRSPSLMSKANSRKPREKSYPPISFGSDHIQLPIFATSTACLLGPLLRTDRCQLSGELYRSYNAWPTNHSSSELPFRRQREKNLGDIHSQCLYRGKLLHMLIISVVLLPTYLTQILWLFPGRVALGPLKGQ